MMQSARKGGTHPSPCPDSRCDGLLSSSFSCFLLLPFQRPAVTIDRWNGARSFQGHLTELLPQKRRLFLFVFSCFLPLPPFLLQVLLLLLGPFFLLLLRALSFCRSFLCAMITDCAYNGLMEAPSYLVERSERTRKLNSWWLCGEACESPSTPLSVCIMLLVNLLVLSKKNNEGIYRSGRTWSSRHVNDIVWCQPFRSSADSNARAQIRNEAKEDNSQDVFVADPNVTDGRCRCGPVDAGSVERGWMWPVGGR